MRKKFSISKKMTSESSPEKKRSSLYFDKNPFSDFDQSSSSASYEKTSNLPAKLLSINQNYQIDTLNSYEYNSIFNQETFTRDNIVELVEQHSTKKGLLQSLFLNLDFFFEFLNIKLLIFY